MHRAMLSILETWVWYQARSEFQYTYLSSQSHAKVMPPQLRELGLKRNTSRANDKMSILGLVQAWL